MRGLVLKRRMATARIGQQHVATLLGIPQPLLNWLLNERVPMPRGYSIGLAAAIGQVTETPHFRGCGCRGIVVVAPTGL